MATVKNSWTACEWCKARHLLDHLLQWLPLQLCSLHSGRKHVHPQISQQVGTSQAVTMQRICHLGVVWCLPPQTIILPLHPIIHPTAQLVPILMHTLEQMVGRHSFQEPPLPCIKGHWTLIKCTRPRQCLWQLLRLHLVALLHYLVNSNRRVLCSHNLVTGRLGLLADVRKTCPYISGNYIDGFPTLQKRGFWTTWL